jgi:hypothetical protein
MNNGILFRADIHRLFEAGYVTAPAEDHFDGLAWCRPFDSEEPGLET